MADFITQFAADEGVSRENFNSRIAAANAGLTTVQGAAAAAQTTANTAVTNAATAKTTADNAATAAAAAQNGVNAINSAKGVASGIATLNTNGKIVSGQASSVAVQKTTSLTLSLADAGCLLWCTSGSTIIITIPANASVLFPVGTEIEVCRDGTGAITFAAASGVTLNSVNNAKNIANQWGCAALKKVNTDKWLLSGDLG